MLFVAFPKLQQHVAFLGVSSFWNHKLRGGFSSLFSTLYECLFHDFSFKQGTGMGGKRDSCEAVRGTAQFAEVFKPACWILAVVMWTSALLTMEIALCCTFAPLLSPKTKQSHLRVAWWYFPKCCGLLASSNQPFLEQLTRHLKGSMCQSLLQELGGLILRVKLEGTCAFFLTELGMKSTCSNSGRGGNRKYHPAESGAPEDDCG